MEGLGKEDPIRRQLEELKTRDEETKQAAGDQLKEMIINDMFELSPDEVGKFWNERIMSPVFELIGSKQPQEVLAGLYAAETIIQIPLEDKLETKRTLFRLWNHIRRLLPNPDATIMVAAAHALGAIVDRGRADFVERFIPFEVSRSLELLQPGEPEGPRWVAVLVLKQLASVPSYFHKQVPNVLNSIWVLLHDKRAHVREDTGELLTSCLNILRERDSCAKDDILLQLVAEATRGCTSTVVEDMHGSLLALKSLFVISDMCLQDHYVRCMELVWEYRNHKNHLIRHTVVAILPTMAFYDPEMFSTRFLTDAMLYLLPQLKIRTERAAAFLTIGHIAEAVKSRIVPSLKPIMSAIKESLRQHGAKRDPPPEDAIFRCIGLLASALGPAFSPHLQGVLDLMFDFGLSDSLCQALQEIVVHIPGLLKTVQDRLLQLLSHVLCGHPYMRPYSPPANKLTHKAPFACQTSAKGDQQIILALTTLRSLNFTGHALSGFASTCVLPYIEHDDSKIRQEAALACLHLLMKDRICQQTNTQAMRFVGDILDKLVALGISDPKPRTRRNVLAALDPPFDRHLSQAATVRALFNGSNDEVFPVRRAAMTVIGRLAARNPACVMPRLRKTIVHLLKQMEHTALNREKAETAQLLGIMISETKTILKPYAVPILKVLLSKAEDKSTAIIIQVLECLGQISRIGGDDLTSHTQKIMDVLLVNLQDRSSSTKQEAALRALGSFCSHTGYVIQPYVDHPNLLFVLRRILDEEARPEVRQEVLRVMGILGAVDPKTFNAKMDEAICHVVSPEDPFDLHLLMATAGPTSEQYLRTAAMKALVGLLEDSSSLDARTAAIEGILAVYRIQGPQCMSFLPLVVPAFLDVARSPTRTDQGFYISEMGKLIGLVSQHIRPFLADVIALFCDLWDIDHPLPPLVSLVEALATALEGEFKAHLPAILPKLVEAFNGHASRLQLLQTNVLHALCTFGSDLDEYMHLILNPVLRTCESQTATPSLRKAAVQTIGRLSRMLNLTSYASAIVHSFLRALAHSDQDVSAAVMDSLCTLLFQLDSNFVVFLSIIDKVVVKCNIKHAGYSQLVAQLYNGQSLAGKFDLIEPFEQDKVEPESLPVTENFRVNAQHLKESWAFSHVSTAADWTHWIRQLGMTMLRESPSHALRACAGAAATQRALPGELFNAGFISCWAQLSEAYQEHLVRSLETALTTPEAPGSIADTLLGLFEFMENNDRPVGLSIRTLCEAALRHHAYAKALHYLELEFVQRTQGPDTVSLVDDIINTQTRLHQTDTAWATLALAKDEYGMMPREEWYEKLGRWEEALEAYESKESAVLDMDEVILGKMRCYHALGEWESLSNGVERCWVNADLNKRSQVAPLAAAAAWARQKWTPMEDYVDCMKHNTPEHSFYGAILALHHHQYGRSLDLIQRTRAMLDMRFTSLMRESYTRAYSIVVRLQTLSELEEIVEYKQAGDNLALESRRRTTWTRRLLGCQPDLETWQRILQVRSLVLTPAEDVPIWIKFANLSRKANRMGLTGKTFESIIGQVKGPAGREVDTSIVYAQLKFLWSEGSRQQDALKGLHHLVDRITLEFGISPHDDTSITTANARTNAQMKLLARCYVKQGQWHMALDKQWKENNAARIIQWFHLATRFDPERYKAWHNWAMANFELVSPTEVSHPRAGGSMSAELLVKHIIAAIRGFIRSISLSNGAALQDALRLLTLWFNFGQQEEVNGAIELGLRVIHVDTWAEVIPQIIARIQTTHPNVRGLISQVLRDVGRAHPQLLVFPLVVASQSQNITRKNASLRILASMREHSRDVVDQALLVSRELVRATLLWQEQWCTAIEEAGGLLFEERNAIAMIAHLEPLHELLEKGTSTFHETSFMQKFGAGLAQARELSQRFQKYGDSSDLNKAWDIYGVVWNKLKKTLHRLTSIELQDAAPGLLRARDLKVAVPGTYRSGKPTIGIARFHMTLSIISSKQRPRKVCIQGTDGHEYQFLLKGHEDLRQDERVMQLFGFVNTLLACDSQSFQRKLHIQQFSVTPMSPHSGLIGWVQDTDTMYVLIKEYRDARQINLGIEQRLVSEMAPDYENLPLLQKVEVFAYALNNTTGQDLYQALWLNSHCSEVWVERRTTYTRSLAVMSMVGSILGLGDRHPRNLLFQRRSGEVVHIDFGDCFELAMQREKYPEKVPFRLTRMLTNAMGVGGLHGSFRKTCEITMQVLRENGESLLALMEAFLYDPLISWRLRQDANHIIPSVESETDAGTIRPAGPGRRSLVDETVIFSNFDHNEDRNDKAVSVYKRVRDKLQGQDFEPEVSLPVSVQVERLITQATSVENLCQAFHGWCPWW